MDDTLQFDDGKARAYYKTLLTRAHLVNCRAVYYKEWAGPAGQIMENPHMIMICLQENGFPDGDVYGCALTEFLDTYAPTNVPNLYRKVALIQAYQPGEPFTFRTVLSDGTVEIPLGHGSETDWIVKNPGGEIYRISDEVFRAAYRLAT
jgi:hypothetical protein